MPSEWHLEIENESPSDQDISTFDILLDQTGKTLTAVDPGQKYDH